MGQQGLEKQRTSADTNLLSTDNQNKQMQFKVIPDKTVGRNNRIYKNTNVK